MIETNAEVLSSWLAFSKISWSFSPSQSRHCEGAWEAEIKTLKFNLMLVTKTFKII